MTGLLLLLGVAWAICPAPTTGADLQQAAQAAEDAFVRLDPDAFDGAVAAMRAALPCLSTSLTAAEAAHLHNTEALAAFLARDEGGTVGAFRAALLADPAVDLGAQLEQTHPIRYERRYATRFEAPPLIPLDPLSGNEHALADGVRLDQQYLDLPMILQRIHADDDIVLASLYLPAGAPLPDWVEVAPPPLSRDLKRRLRLGGLATTSVVTSGALIRSASRNHSLYLAPGTPYSSLDTLERRANLYSSLAIGSTVLTAGVGAFVVWAW